jgi:hypothetical protein
MAAAAPAIVVALMRLAIFMARLLFRSLRACDAASTQARSMATSTTAMVAVSSTQPTMLTQARSMMVGSSAR